MSRKRHGAFTFVEVVMAVFVIGVALAPILWFFTISSRSTRVTINEVNASNLASEILETIQGIPFEFLENVDGPLNPETAQTIFAKAKQAGITVTLPKPPDDQWKFFLKIEPISLEKQYPPETAEPVKEAADTAATLRRIQVIIQWPEEGRQQELKLVTARGAGS